MHTLLGYVKRDKFVDHLSERLAARLGTVAEVRSVPVSARAASVKACWHLVNCSSVLVVKWCVQCWAVHHNPSDLDATHAPFPELEPFCLCSTSCADCDTLSKC